jgi:hypothetical protein
MGPNATTFRSTVSFTAIASVRVPPATRPLNWAGSEGPIWTGYARKT